MQSSRESGGGTYRQLGGVPAGDFFYKNKAVPRSIIAPGQWSKNKYADGRPMIPIRYDIRGRRLTNDG